MSGRETARLEAFSDGESERTAVVLYGVGTLLGAFVPVLGLAVFAALIPF